MRRLAVLSAFLVLVGLVAPVLSPQRVLAAPLMPGIAITIRPTELRPAQAGFVHVGGAYPLDVSVTLDGQPQAVYWIGDGYLSLFAFDFDALPGERQLAVSVFDPATGSRLARSETITVVDFRYPDEYLALAYRQLTLLDPDLNLAELARLDAVYAARTPLNIWSWPFDLPVPAGIVTSRFGGSRSYNSGLWRAHHTGTDFRRTTGEPVLSAASGRVAAAEFFDVRGNVVIIDHGYGVFTQYAHLADVLVRPGEFVQRGQLIGLAGATGRTSGPHLHYEVIVNGIPIDPIYWMALEPGFIPPRELPPEQAQDEGEPGG